jgi:class 3 adenylate cyclase
MYSVLLAIGIHHREMIQRKSLNYDRILSYEILKTNALISKLVPAHILSVIRNEKRQVDEFEDLTLLYTDFVGFNSMTRKFEDQRETINLLSKIFARFDQLCEEYKVYKVHTIGNQFVLMGYNGKIEKNRRSKQVIIDEANRVIQVGFEMVDYIKEISSDLQLQHQSDLHIRVGIHTGRVIAGIIGSKIVRYDILGEGVLITKKVQLNGETNSVCISEDTKKFIMQAPDIA